MQSSFPGLFVMQYGQGWLPQHATHWANLHANPTRATINKLIQKFNYEKIKRFHDKNHRTTSYSFTEWIATHRTRMHSRVFCRRGTKNTGKWKSKARCVTASQEQRDAGEQPFRRFTEQAGVDLFFFANINCWCTNWSLLWPT